MSSDEGEGVFAQLHALVVLQVLEHLDPRSLCAFSLSSKSLRALCLEFVRFVRVPPTTTRNQLLAFRPRTAFPHARHLKLQGEYAKLRAADIEEWLRLHVLSQPPLSQPASTGPVTGPSSVTAGGAASGPGTGAGLAQGASHFMALDMSEVSLSGAVPVSFLTCLPERWPGLQQLSLHHTPLSCPLDCTDPVTLDRLIRNLYAQEGRPLPHLTILRNQVTEHEGRLHANLLVTSKVLDAVSRLPSLTRLSIISRYVHPHDLALGPLARADRLTSLTLQLPSVWPLVTVHGLQALPPSLQELRLLTQRPVHTWQALAQLPHTATAQGAAAGGPAQGWGASGTGQGSSAASSFRCYLDVDFLEPHPPFTGTSLNALSPGASTGLPGAGAAGAAGHGGRAGGRADAGASGGGAGRGRGRGGGRGNSQAAAVAAAAAAAATAGAGAGAGVGLGGAAAVAGLGAGAGAGALAMQHGWLPPGGAGAAGAAAVGALVGPLDGVDPVLGEFEVLPRAPAGGAATAPTPAAAPAGPFGAVAGIIGGTGEAGPRGGGPAAVLPALGCLRGLRFRSRCAEAPEPEPEEDGTITPVPEDPVERYEADLLSAMLAAAPELEELDLANAGPLLTSIAALHADRVPKQDLKLACHSRVDPTPLLISCPRARVHLTLKGATPEQLEAVVATQGGVGPSLNLSQQGGGHGQLVSLSLVRCHELADDVLLAALASLPSLSKLTLSTCRAVTCDLVQGVARLRRPIRLRVSQCRLVCARGWEAAVHAAREVKDSWLVDVKYANEQDLGFEVAFE